MASQLQLSFQKPYEKSVFIKDILLPIFSSSRVSTYPNPKDETALLTTTETKIIKSVTQYGLLTLDDDSEVKLYEILLQPNIQLEYNKIGIQNYIRKTLLSGEAVLVNFVQPQNLKNWRLSFIERDIKLLNNEIKEVKSNPKRYTYIVGQTEVCKTVANRFETLQNAARIVLRPSKIDDKTPNLLKVFSVETLSKTFFDDYKYKHYSRFVEAIMGWSVVKKGKIDVWSKTGKESAFYIKAFKEKYTEEKAQAEARNFVKKLLGRIVFLYFVQKKGWLGASTTDYHDGFDGAISNKDGNADGFMLHLFKTSKSTDNFYEIWLKELFFKTLNEPRQNDNFEMPDKSIVKIPFLNGGLFEEEKHDKIPTIIPAQLFHNPDFFDDDKQRGFLDFLNSFNFTIYEDSPEDHTVAVDPEMLGHIFENLLEDNKDKGAYYTPKEIVHYMCQESIIEYLNTKLNPEETPIYHASSGLSLVEKENKTLLTHPNPDYDKNRTAIEDFVKNKVHNDFLLHYAKDVNKYLDAVKVCDPAIGSGAFPMGVMQEIFALKMVLYDLEFETSTTLFHERDLKHQNYRRDTKLNIIQNSIYGVDIERGAVDIARLRFWLSLIVDENKPQALPNLDYKIVVGDSLIPKFDGEILAIDWEKKTTVSAKYNTYIAEGKQLLKDIVYRQRKYFDPNTKNKPKAVAEIRNLKIALLINQLAYNKLYYLDNNAKLIDSGLGLSAKDRQKNVVIDLHIAQLDEQTHKLNKLLQNADLPFDHFDWKLDFPEILNDQVAEVVGFDIVIGNPPYVNVEKVDKIIKDNIKNFITAYQKFDLYVLFYEKSINLLKNNAIISFITSNKFLSQGYGFKLRQLFLENSILEITNFNFDIFDSATVRTCILNLKKQKKVQNTLRILDICKKEDNSKFVNRDYDYLNQDIFHETDENNFRINLTTSKVALLRKLEVKTIRVDDICSVNYGLRPNSEKLSLKKEDYIFEVNQSGTYKKYFEGKDMGYWLIAKSNFLNYQPSEIYNPMFPELFEYEKIVGIRTLSDIGKLRFIYDNDGFYNNDSVVNLTLWHLFESIKYQSVVRNITDKKILNSKNYSYKYLQAILNSKIIKFYVEQLLYDGTHFYPNHMKQLPIKQIPLPAQQPFITLVDQILEAKKANLPSQQWEDEIDIRVYHLYELSYEEACVIDRELKFEDFEQFSI